MRFSTMLENSTNPTTIRAKCNFVFCSPEFEKKKFLIVDKRSDYDFAVRNFQKMKKIVLLKNAENFNCIWIWHSHTHKRPHTAWIVRILPLARKFTIKRLTLRILLFFFTFLLRFKVFFLCCNTRKNVHRVKQNSIFPLKTIHLTIAILWCCFLCHSISNEYKYTYIVLTLCFIPIHWLRLCVSVVRFLILPFIFPKFVAYFPLSSLLSK